MRKLLIGVAIAAAVASGNVLAQEKTAGPNAGKMTIGGVEVTVPGLAVAGFAVATAVAANSSGNAPARQVIIPPVVPPVDPDPTCNGDDALVDGVCIGSTVTTTVTGTGTGTMTSTLTITVPVTVTYLPTN